MGIIKLFSYLYDKTIRWSTHRHAPYYLAGVSFAESSFFPIPPDVMLLSMGLAKPETSWRNAFIATCFSVMGGIFGYLIGHFAMELIDPFIHSASFQAHYQQLVGWFKYYGIWMVIIAGFSPFPYKIFTIAAGIMGLPFLPFVLGSLIGRGGRFFTVCTILYFYGERIQGKLRLYIDFIGWFMVVAFVLAFLFIKFYS